jgi:hypothetical protein
MDTTIDLYYDPGNPDPWAIAASGIRGFGYPVVRIRNIGDNAYCIVGDETDAELREYAESLVECEPLSWTDYDGDEHTVSQEESAIGYLRVLTHLRDAQADSNAKDAEYNRDNVA